METKKLLNGSVDKNVVMGLSWLFGIFALVAFIVDFKTLDLEEKREFVSILVCWAVTIVLVCTVALSFLSLVVFVFAIIAAINAFQGKSFKVPGAYHLAAAIIK